MIDMDSVQFKYIHYPKQHLTFPKWGWGEAGAEIYIENGYGEWGEAGAENNIVNGYGEMS